MQPQRLALAQSQSALPAAKRQALRINPHPPTADRKLDPPVGEYARHVIAPGGQPQAVEPAPNLEHLPRVVARRVAHLLVRVIDALEDDKREPVALHRAFGRQPVLNDAIERRAGIAARGEQLRRLAFVG